MSRFEQFLASLAAATDGQKWPAAARISRRAFAGGIGILALGRVLPASAITLIDCEEECLSTLPGQECQRTKAEESSPECCCCEYACEDEQGEYTCAYDTCDIVGQPPCPGECPE